MPAGFKLSLQCRSGAPRKPSRAAWTALFEHAWQHVPAKCRKAAGSDSPAVDLHLIGDNEIAELNFAHMRHRGATDVLSFPMGEFDPERGAFFLGEIIVSHETAVREARLRGLTTENELARYAVHGFLHLLGYDDSTKTEAAAMSKLQERILASAAKKLAVLR